MNEFFNHLKNNGYKISGEIATLCGIDFRICSGIINSARGKRKSWWLEIA